MRGILGTQIPFINFTLMNRYKLTCGKDRWFSADYWEQWIFFKFKKVKKYCNLSLHNMLS